jgi:hypothetical protein
MLRTLKLKKALFPSRRLMVNGTCPRIYQYEKIEIKKVCEQTWEHQIDFMHAQRANTFEMM